MCITIANLIDELAQCESIDDRIATLRSHDSELVRRTLGATYDARRDYKVRNVRAEQGDVLDDDGQWSSFLDVLEHIGKSTRMSTSAIKKLLSRELTGKSANFHKMAKHVLCRHLNVGINITSINAALEDCIFTLKHQKIVQYDGTIAQSTYAGHSDEHILIEPMLDLTRMTIVIDASIDVGIRAWTENGIAIALPARIDKQVTRLRALNRLHDCVLTGYDVLVNEDIIIDAVVPLESWTNRSQTKIEHMQMRQQLEDMRSHLSDMGMSVIEQHAITRDDIDDIITYFSQRNLRGIIMKRMSDVYSWNMPSAYMYLVDDVFEGIIDGFKAGMTRSDSDRVVSMSVRLQSDPNAIVDVEVESHHWAIAREMWYNRTRYRGRTIKFRASNGIDDDKIHNARFEALADEDD